MSDYESLSERMKNGTVGCKCNKCGSVNQKKDSTFVKFPEGHGEAYLCEKCSVDFIKWLMEGKI